MKKLYSFLILFSLLLFTGQQAFAADVANDTVSVIQGETEITFYGHVDFADGAGTDNCFTQAMESPYLDWANATFRVYSNAAANDDVNVFFLGGGNVDLTYMSKVYTQTAFDDVNGGTPKAWWAFKDTLTATTPEFFVDPVAGERFKVIQFDGQTGNTTATELDWYLTVPVKPQFYGRATLYFIKDTE